MNTERKRHAYRDINRLRASFRISYDSKYDQAIIGYTPGQTDLQRTRGKFGYSASGRIVTRISTTLSLDVNLRGFPLGRRGGRRAA